MAVDVDLLNSNSINNIQENFERVQTALQDSVSRSGTTPNQMNADLDMNSNDLLNVGLIQAEDISIDGSDVTGILERAEAEADAAAASAEAALIAQLAAEQAAAGAGVTDGDKGDVIVSEAGTVWTAPRLPVESQAWANANFTPVTAPEFIQTAGYNVAGDGGAALYKKVESEPSHEGKFFITLADTVTVVWYEVVDKEVNQFVFGAKGDFTIITGIITSGDNTLTVSGGAFTPDDVGKSIVIKHAGASGGPLVTTIASVTNATTVELTDAAGATTTGSLVNGVPSGYGGYGTDDTVALQNLHAFCEATGANFNYAQANHYVTGMIQITTNGNAGSATFYFDADGFRANSITACVLLGRRVGRITGREITLPYVVNISHIVGDDWTTATLSYANIACVEAANVNNCRIWNVSGYGAGVGLRATGYSAGTQANVFYLNAIISNRYNILLTHGDNSGWCNENEFNGGGVGLGEFEVGNAGFRSVRLQWSDSNANAAPNNNRFRSINFEGIAISIDVTGSRNLFDHCRYEITSGLPVFTLRSTATKGVSHNTVRGGWAADQIVFVHVNGGAAIIWNELETPTSKVYSGDRELFKWASQSGNTIVFSVFKTGDDPLLKAYNDPSYMARMTQNSLSFKADTDDNPKAQLSAGALYLGDGTVTPTTGFGLSANGTLSVTGNLRPTPDNTLYLGTSAAARWAGGYLGMAMTVTSDAREKEWLGGPNEAERRAARAIAAKIGFYHLINGPSAGTGRHAGSLAQNVEAALIAEGLDPKEYAFLTHDVIEATPAVFDDEGNEIEPAVEAVDLYGLVYEELNQFLLATLFADQADINARLLALEERE